MVNLIKFLQAAFNMVKRGDIKKIEDLLNLLNNSLEKLGIFCQIKDIFTKGKAAVVTETRKKDIIEAGDLNLVRKK